MTRSAWIRLAMLFALLAASVGVALAVQASGSSAGWGIGGAGLVLFGCLVAFDIAGFADGLLTWARSLNAKGTLATAKGIRMLGVLFLVIGIGWLAASWS